MQKSQAVSPGSIPASAAASGVVDVHVSQPAYRKPLHAVAGNSLAAAINRAEIAVLPAEVVTLHALALPVRGERQRRAAVPFALEDRLARPIDDVAFALCGAARDGRMLVATTANGAMQDAVAQNPGLRLLPEQMLLPVPAAESERTVWLVWREGNRALVRVSDGTGFAARIDMLPLLWQRAGKPIVQACGAALPSTMDWQDSSDPAPRPGGDDLAVDLRQGRFAPPRQIGQPLKALGIALALAALAHLALAWADLRALRVLEADLRANATMALARAVPGASASDDPRLLMRRIQAAQSPTQSSGFLPLLGTVSEAWLAGGNDVSLKRMVWSATDGALRLQVEARGLDGLQGAEESLRAVGLGVTSGTAVAADGAAQAELTVRAR